MAISSALQNRFIELTSDLDIKNKTDVASAIGITYATFSKLYNYGIVPTVPVLMRIADYFNISVDYLIGNTDIDAFVKSKNPTTFHKRLYDLRIENNIATVYKLAELIHIHRNNISQWYKNASIPLIDEVVLIADYFNVSIDYLLGRTDDKTI